MRDYWREIAVWRLAKGRFIDLALRNEDFWGWKRGGRVANGRTTCANIQ